MNDEPVVALNNTVNDNLFVKLIRIVAYILMLIWVLSPIIMLYFYYFNPLFWANGGYSIIAGLIGVYSLGVAIVYFITQLLRRQVSVMHSILEKPWNFALLLLLSWCFITAWLQNDYSNAIIGNGEATDGLIMVIMCAGVYGSSLVIGDLKCVKWLYVAMIIASTATCLAMVQHFFFPSFSAALQDSSIADYYSLATVFYNSNVFGYYLVMAVMIIIGMLLLSRHIIPQLCLLLLLFGHSWVIFQQGAFGPILATAIAALIIPIYLVRSGRLKIIKYVLALVVLLSIAIGVCVIFKDTIFGSERAVRDFIVFRTDIEAILDDPNSLEALNSGTGRWVLWQESLGMIKESPIYGYGPMEFQMVMREKMSLALGIPIDENSSLHFWPHNEILQYAAYYGIIGCLLYLFALASIFIYQWNHIKKISSNALIADCAVIGYFISSMVGIVICYTVPLFYLFLGFASCFDGLPSKDQENDSRIRQQKKNRPKHSRSVLQGKEKIG